MTHYYSNRGFIDKGDGTYNFYWDSISDTGGDWTFEENPSISHDIEKVFAINEAKKLKNMATLVELEYGFSETRAIEVSSLVSNWNRLSKARAMTANEADSFSVEIPGTTMDQVENAMLDSAMDSDTLLEELTSNAAVLNGTSPEGMSALIKTLLN